MTIKQELGQRLAVKKEELITPDYKGNKAREARKPFKPKKYRDRFLVRRHIAEGKGSETELFSVHDKTAGRDVCAKMFFGINGPLLQEFKDRIVTRNNIGGSAYLIEFYECMALSGKETNPVLLMELGVEGLRKKLLGLDEGTTFSLEETLYVGTSICFAIRDVHAHNLSNIDLKPDHVLYVLGEEDGQHVGLVKLCDVFETARESGQTTRTIGRSDRYAAPEVGQDGYTPDPLSDIYPIGLILYEMATSSYFFINEKGREIKGRAREKTKNDQGWVKARVQTVNNPYLAVAIEGCLQPPGKRYQKSEEVIRDLEAIDLWRAQHEPVLYIDWNSPSADDLGVVYEARVAVADRAAGSRVIAVLDVGVETAARTFAETYSKGAIETRPPAIVDRDVIDPLAAAYTRLLVGADAPIVHIGGKEVDWDLDNGRFLDPETK